MCSGNLGGTAGIYFRFVGIDPSLGWDGVFCLATRIDPDFADMWFDRLTTNGGQAHHERKTGSP
ncbi:MAG: hypothetical protein CL694_06920 [Chloroflexi bacterium]|nr:hypothetical protein [Chloroflexota bacterium]